MAECSKRVLQKIGNRSSPISGVMGVGSGWRGRRLAIADSESDLGHSRRQRRRIVSGAGVGNLNRDGVAPRRLVRQA